MKHSVVVVLFQKNEQNLHRTHLFRFHDLSTTLSPPCKTLFLPRVITLNMDFFLYMIASLIGLYLACKGSHASASSCHLCFIVPERETKTRSLEREEALAKRERDKDGANTASGVPGGATRCFYLR
ncbi:hypothetical protein Hdeb2414_s0053g00754141 [Helianthus debilis subsp. tardiflorus]